MFNFGTLKKSINDIATQAQTLRSAIETKKQQRDDLETLPLPRKDLGDQVCSMVDGQSDIYIKRISQALEFARTHPLYDFGNARLDLIATTGGSVSPGHMPRENVMFFFGDLLKSRLRDAIGAMDWPDKCGPPLAAREPAIEKLNEEIADLEKQEFDLRQQAEQAGIHIGRVDSKPEPGRYGGTVKGVKS